MMNNTGFLLSALNCPDTRASALPPQLGIPGNGQLAIAIWLHHLGNPFIGR